MLSRLRKTATRVIKMAEGGNTYYQDNGWRQHMLSRLGKEATHVIKMAARSDTSCQDGGKKYWKHVIKMEEAGNMYRRQRNKTQDAGKVKHF